MTCCGCFKTASGAGKIASTIFAMRFRQVDKNQPFTLHLPCLYLAIGDARQKGGIGRGSARR